MELVKPAFGLVFWMTLSFLIIMFLLKKFAWPVILKSLDERERRRRFPGQQTRARKWPHRPPSALPRNGQ